MTFKARQKKLSIKGHTRMDILWDRGLSEARGLLRGLNLWAGDSGLDLGDNSRMEMS